MTAADASERFIEHLAAERDRRGLAQVEVRQGFVEDLDIPRESLDGAYARWLFCWLEDPGAVLEKVAAAVKPGGVITIQDYFDWHTFALLPRTDAFDRIIDACMRSWAVPINVAQRLPELGEALGLTTKIFRPVARIGAVGSPEWRWLGGFLRNYLPKLVGRGLLAEAHVDAWREDWAGHETTGRGHIYAPTLADIALRK